MLRTTATRLDTQRRHRHILLRLKLGLLSLKDPKKCVLFSSYILFLAFLYARKDSIIANIVSNPMLIPFETSIYNFVLRIYAATSIFLLLLLFSIPRGAWYISDALHRAGVVNAIDEPPILIRRFADNGNINIAVLDFLTEGISRAELEKLKPEIESALNVFILRVADGPGRNRVLLYTVSARSCIPDSIPWDSSKLPIKENELVLGQTLAGTDVTVNIAKIPHVLLGGSTGSGKSVLLRLLLRQCVEKGYEVYIADFKGGLDYLFLWLSSARVLLSAQTLLQTLTSVITEMEIRKKLFASNNVRNITEYNQLNPTTALPHIIFAVDELAELLDKTGLSKERKAEIDEVVNLLSTIARLGRAFGIHLILATQRPDANILPGQIKCNIDIRICGRADKVLSQIILDSSDAADRIPKDSHLFLLQDGTLFQPYIVND